MGKLKNFKFSFFMLNSLLQAVLASPALTSKLSKFSTHRLNKKNSGRRLI